jgi:hypothetical protein
MFYGNGFLKAKYHIEGETMWDMRCDEKSIWYTWKIYELALIHNYSFTHSKYAWHMKDIATSVILTQSRLFWCDITMTSIMSYHQILDKHNVKQCEIWDVMRNPFRANHDNDIMLVEDLVIWHYWRHCNVTSEKSRRYL